MIRRFLSGLSWGAAASVVGLSLISQIAMPSYRTNQAANDVAAPENSAVAKVSPSDTVVEENAADVPAVAANEATVAAESAAEPAVEPTTPAVSGTTVALPEMPAATVEQVETQVVPKEGAVTPPVGENAPSLEAATEGADIAPVSQPKVESALPEIVPSGSNAALPPVVPGADPAPQATAAKVMPALDVTEAAPKVEDAPAAAEQPIVAAKPDLPDATDASPAKPADVVDPAPEVVVVPEPEVAPEVVVTETPAKPSVLETNTEVTLLPDSGLKEQVEGVVTGRLAVIEPQPADVAVDGVAEVDPNLATIPADAVDEASPLVKYAQDYDAVQTNPLFAILLVDDGSTDLDRAALAKMPLPVSFVIDPLAANAKEAAAMYRAAGHEVLMLASGIPAGATAGDVEQTFQAHAAVLPEAVAVLDMSIGGFQDNGPLAGMVVPVLDAQGRGLITFDRGLNAADQVARRESVPAATIFRILDAENENPALIRRYLDRAAFKAAQEGHVMVLGTARPETVGAILEWAVEGRSTTVTLVPATAVLDTN